MNCFNSPYIRRVLIIACLITSYCSIQATKQEDFENAFKEHLIQQTHLPRYFIHEVKKLSDSQSTTKNHKITALAFSPDGNHLISAYNKAVQVWSINHLYKLSFNSEISYLEQNKSLSLGAADIKALAFHSNNKTFACGSRFGTIFIHTLGEEQYFRYQCTATIKSLRFLTSHPDTLFALASSYQTFLSLYLNIQDKEKLILTVKELPSQEITFKELTKIEQTVAISPQERFFTTCSQGQNFHVWSLFNMNPYPQTRPYLYVQKLDPSRSTSSPATLGSLFPGSDPLTLGLENAYPKIPEMNNIINHAISLVSFSQDEDIFAFGTQDKKIFLQYGTQQQHLYTTYAKITALEFSHDHQLIAAGLEDGTILLLKSIKTLSFDVISLIARLIQTPSLTHDQLKEDERAIYDQIPPEALPQHLR